MILAGLILASVTAAAQDGYARSIVPGSEATTPICLAWPQRNLTYAVDVAGSAQIASDSEFAPIDAAFQTWQKLSDTCSDFRFTVGPRQTQPKVGLGTEGNNVVVFRDDSCAQKVSPDDACWVKGTCANLFGCWDESDFTIAVTTTTYSKRTGVLYDADIEVNTAPHSDGSRFVFTTVNSPPCPLGSEATTCVAVDIQNTMTHEVGHFLGFAHVDVPGSTMELSAPVGETSKRIIDPGTANGFCLVYPRGQPPAPCDEKAVLNQTINAYSTGTPGCGCSNGTPAVALMLVVLGWLQAGLRRTTRSRR